MLSLISDKEIEILEQEHDACIFKKDLEYEMVHNSPDATITLPEVFLIPLFEVLYNKVYKETKFIDGNDRNWSINNLDGQTGSKVVDLDKLVADYEEQQKKSWKDALDEHYTK
tara:strand:+ start:157 stop:495 length:339 start_codon:yes stop_codon:yes gene_type:complete